MEHPTPDFHAEYVSQCKKARLGNPPLDEPQIRDANVKSTPLPKYNSSWSFDSKIRKVPCSRRDADVRTGPRKGRSRPASKSDQPRVRERIMKLSKVYSATCHHRYSSER